MTATAPAPDLARSIWPDPEKAPSRVIECRHCARKNRVAVPDAALAPEKCECGACGKPLFLGPDEPLERISSTAYEHPLDRASLELLKTLPGFAAALRWFLAQLGERSTRHLFLANHVLCGEDQFPELVRLLDAARRRLDIPYRPALYLGESPFMNALTTGVEEPSVVVQSALLDQLSDVEVTAVMAHELGHLHADHMLYQILAHVLLAGGAVFGGLAVILTLPIQKALLKWARCAELTSDRAGLLGSRDLGACLG
ncbi:M48 family metallopeptidase, partial [bacterium]|nr:M48 family metallopeptidase [bacterium]